VLFKPPLRQAAETMRRNPSELRRIARSATPTDARRPPGLRTSVVLTKFPNSEQAPL